MTLAPTSSEPKVFSTKTIILSNSLHLSNRASNDIRIRPHYLSRYISKQQAFYLIII